MELHLIASHDDPRQRSSSRVTTQVPCGAIECQVLQSSTRQCATVSLSLSLSLLRPASGGASGDEEGLLQALRNAFRDALLQVGRGPSPLCARTFYKRDSALAGQLAAGKPAS